MNVNISDLMDDYLDEEFGPQEAGPVSPEAVQARVLAQLPGKRRPRRWRKGVVIGLIAATLVVCLTGAGLAMQHFTTYSGWNVIWGDEELSFSATYENENASFYVELAEGRIWFVLEDTRTDITDLIDADTPYIYAYEDAETGTTGYLIVGGTPDCYGWMEYATGTTSTGDIWITMGGEDYEDTGWYTAAMEQLGLSVVDEES